MHGLRVSNKKGTTIENPLYITLMNFKEIMLSEKKLIIIDMYCMFPLM